MNLFKKIRYKLQSKIVKLSLKNESGNFMICNPLRIDGARFILIENNVFIRDMAWLAADKQFSSDPSLQIGEGTYIGDFAHIYATGKIVIENDVLIANNVYIADNTHSYEDINLSIKEQTIKPLPPVRIGSGSWIGEKVSIIGASVGKHCVIGANSVVTKDIPDYSIAVGTPAKVIKSYNFETKSWEKQI